MRIFEQTIGAQRRVTVPDDIDEKQIRMLIARGYVEVDPSTRSPRSKATALLEGYLDQKQLDEYRTYKAFTVIGSDGCRYIIDCTKRSGNVYNVTTGKMMCVVLSDWECPNEDQYAAQKLQLEIDAPAFCKLANTFGGGRQHVRRAQMGEIRDNWRRSREQA